MNEVYVVLRHVGFEGDSIYGIYSNLEKAESVVAKKNTDTSTPYSTYYSVEPWHVNTNTK